MTEILLLTDSQSNRYGRLHREKRRNSSIDWRINNPEKVLQFRQKYGSKYRLARGSKPMSENKTCTAYLGVHIAERVLSKVFVNVTRMPYGFKGYDFICSKGHTIDVKSSCLILSNAHHIRTWKFCIKKNKVAEYFLCLAFDNRDDLNPRHIWLIKGDIVNHYTTLGITDSLKSILKWSQYEQTEKLEKIVECCNMAKSQCSDKRL